MALATRPTDSPLRLYSTHLRCVARHRLLWPHYCRRDIIALPELRTCNHAADNFSPRRSPYCPMALTQGSTACAAGTTACRMRIMYSNSNYRFVTKYLSRSMAVPSAQMAATTWVGRKRALLAPFSSIKTNEKITSTSGFSGPITGKSSKLVASGRSIPWAEFARSMDAALGASLGPMVE